MFIVCSYDIFSEVKSSFINDKSHITNSSLTQDCDCSSSCEGSKRKCVVRGINNKDLAYNLLIRYFNIKDFN